MYGSFLFKCKAAHCIFSHEDVNPLDVGDVDKDSKRCIWTVKIRNTTVA